MKTSSSGPAAIRASTVGSPRLVAHATSNVRAPDRWMETGVNGGGKTRRSFANGGVMAS